MPGSHPELFDPARSPDYAEILEDIRNDEEIFYFEGSTYRTWIVTRYDHVKALLRDERLIQPSLMPRIATFTEEQQRALLPMQEFARLNLGKDRERKLALRQATKQFFMPAGVDRIRPRVREIIDLLHEEIDPSAPVDLIGRFTYPMPAWVLAEIMGVPREDRNLFIGWSNALIRYFRSYTFEQFHAAQAGVVEMLDYCAERIETRLAEGPGDEDLVDVFARLLGAGEFELGELSSSAATFLMAGHENTSHFIGNVFNMLFQHPDAFKALKEDMGLLPGVMNEVLRYNGVVPFVTREVLEDVEFEGHLFERGQLISLSLFSANRDERRWADMNRFDIHRPDAKHHLGFGHGEEYCRGAHLALMEAEELIRFLLGRYPDMEPVAGGMETDQQVMLRRYITRFDVLLNAC